MIIQHVSASDNSGGAARAAYRLHRAMRDAFIESKMLVQYKIGDDPYVYSPKSRIRRALGLVRPYVGQMILGLEPQYSKTIRCAAWLPSGPVFDGLTPEVADMKPSGFMGRAFPQQHEDLALPRRISDWTDDHILVALGRRGDDLGGAHSASRPRRKS